jgi:hypothetical protein
VARCEVLQSGIWNFLLWKTQLDILTLQVLAENTNMLSLRLVSFTLFPTVNHTRTSVIFKNSP